MRTAVQLAGLVLVLGGLTTACGGDDDQESGDKGSTSSSGGVSTEDFCTKFNSLYESVLRDIDTTKPKETIQATKKWAGELEDLGAPKDMPKDVEHGFDVFVDTVQGVDDDASIQDLQKLGDDLPKDDQQAGETFGDWTKENCPIDSESPSPDAPSDSPSDG